MRVEELFVNEDAEGDLHFQTKAQRLARQFGAWFVPRNEDTPLGEMEEMIHVNLPRRAEGKMLSAYITKASKFAPEYDDLYMGFAWNEDGTTSPTGAFMAPGTMEGRRAFFVIIMLPNDRSHDIDILFGVKWDHLIHELTHYMDRKRQTTPSKKSFSGLARSAQGALGGEKYFNHPLEFNAFYQQGLYSVVQALSRGQNSGRMMRSFSDFYSAMVGHFDIDFMHYLTPEYRRKFLKRFNSFYELVKREWPDLNSIRAAVKVNSEED